MIKQISDAKSVMNGIMENLNSGKLTRDKEQTIGEELTLDEKFIGESIESYHELLKSTIMQELETGPILTNRKKIQGNQSIKK